MLMRTILYYTTLIKQTRLLAASVFKTKHAFEHHGHMLYILRMGFEQKRISSHSGIDDTNEEMGSVRTWGCR